MYYDVLAKVKNAARAKKTSFLTAFSKADFEVARTLVEAGYLKDVQKKVIDRKNFLEIRPAYAKGRPAMNDFKLVSKPSRHVYKTSDKLFPVKQGYGIAVLSTSKGIMTNRSARKAGVGGEYLFEVW